MEWKDATKEKPEKHFSVLVYGTLEDEPSPDTHEGYWTGKAWESVRTWETGFQGGHAPVIAALQWARRPTPNVQIEGQPASGLSRSNAGLGHGWNNDE